ncbi:hypothetical protein OXX69_013847, partial [Metschnikowia pulcherrima]
DRPGAVVGDVPDGRVGRRALPARPHRLDLPGEPSGDERVDDADVPHGRVLHRWSDLRVRRARRARRVDLLHALRLRLLHHDRVPRPSRRRRPDRLPVPSRPLVLGQELR